MAAPAPSTPPAFTQRPWVTAGVALTAAGMVAAAPVAVPDVPQFNFPDIQLTATGDLLTDTAGNLTNLVDYFAGVTPADFLVPRVDVGAPFPILQQVIANQVGYLGQFLQGDFTGPFESMFGNLQAGIAAPFGEFADSLATGGPLEVVGLPVIDVLGIHYDINDVVEGLIKTLIGADDLSRLGLFDSNLVDVVQSLLGVGGLEGLFNFTASPMSGLMLGVMGPVLGPMIALANDMGTVFDGDPAALLGIPEHMLYAFLNGGETLSLVDLLGVFGIDTSFTQELDLLGIDLGTLHGGLDEAGIALGGILGGPGSLFNALTAEAGLFYDAPCVLGICPDQVGGDIEWFGDGAGPLGSFMSIPNSIAAAIGTGGIEGMDAGLLSTISTAFGLDDITAGLTDISTFLSSNILDPLGDALMFLPNELAGLLSDSGLGVDLGIHALAQMFVDIPQLLLTMML